MDYRWLINEIKIENHHTELVLLTGINNGI